MIKLTKGASIFVKNIVERKGSAHHLRVKPVEGGCSGLYYDIVFDNKKKAKDNVLTTEGIKVLVDESIKSREQTTIDYIKTMNGPSLISSNPKFRVNLWIEDY